MKLVNRFRFKAPDNEVFIRVLSYPVGEADDHADLHRKTLVQVMEDHPRCEVTDLGWELKINE